MAEWVVFRLSALGDVTLMTGVLDHAHRQYGHTFTVITRSPQADLFVNHPAVSEIITLPRRLSPAETLRCFRSLARRFNGRPLLDWHGTLRSRLLSLLWQGPVRRYRKDGTARRLFLFSRKPLLRALRLPPLFARRLATRTVTQRYAATLVPAGTPLPPASELVPRVYLTPQEQQAAALRLAPLRAAYATSDSAPPLVALHPYATHANKTWPDGFWLALMRLLQGRGIPFFVIGQTGKRDHPLALPSPQTSEQTSDFTNQTSLRETCGLLACADVLVSGDSGPLHLACAVMTPVIALFGPTTLHWGFFPQGPQDQVLELPCACRPCSLHGQGHCPYQLRCLHGITPELVFAAVEKMGAAAPNPARWA